MPVLFDADGNQVDVLDPEAAAALEAKAQRTEELEAQLREKEEKLAKLEQKDFNWRNFETAKEEEKAKILEGFSAEKQELIKAEAERRKEVADLKESIASEREEVILSQIAGNDEELRKQIKDAASQFVGEARNTRELADRYSKAYTLLKGVKPQLNPLNAYTPFTETPQKASGSKYTQSEEGKANLKSWFGIES